MMTDTEPLEHLDFDFSLPCESRSHTQLRDGCEVGGPATHIIEIYHPLAVVPGGRTHPSSAAVRQELVCEGRVIWLRGRLENMTRCEACGATARLSDWVKIIGPIS